MRKGIQNKKRTAKPQEKTRIVYIGNFRPYFSTENDIKKSFEHIGWEVIPFQENEITLDNYREVVEEANNARFLLYTRTWHTSDTIWTKIMKAVNVPTVSFHLDLYLGLERGKDLGNDPFFQSDYVFSADGGHAEEFKKLGINHYFLAPAVLHESVYLGKKVDKFEGDLCFVGAFTYHKEWSYRPQLISWLDKTYGKKFKLWGATGEVIRGDDLNNLYNSVKVIAGDSTYSPNYWSDRIPETLGRGGFLIHPYVEGLYDQFEPYKHFIPYEHGNFEMLKEIIDYYIKHDKERDAIRLAGMEHVKKNHTYVNRVEEIIKTLKDEHAI